MEILFSPPLAFLIYLALVAALYGIGRLLAGPASPDPVKSSTYASGEAPPSSLAAPGYRPFFVVALFFAMLHLGVLVLSSGDLSTGGSAAAMAIIYLVGLMLALVALILG